MMKLLIIFIIIYITSCQCQTKKKLDWWQERIIYQIYPQSFYDTNKDGVGDLTGVMEKLSYLKSIGVGCIWLSPILKSPMDEYGYDVSNFREIDPYFGTMDDFDTLLRKARRMGIKVIIDFVPNHTSNKHEWFQKSIKKIPPFTDYYIWKNPKNRKGKRVPPNNWLSDFGKSAWEWNEERGQYYLHQFSIYQPDLNYRNPVVYEEMKNNIIFWLDKGVDGIRMDSVNFIYENPKFPNEPRSYLPNVTPDEQAYLKHIHSRNQKESIEIVKDWRKLFDKYLKKDSKNPTRIFISEAYADVDYCAQLYGNETHPGAHIPFNFIFMTTIGRESDASHLATTISEWYEKMPKHGWANWVIGNHDNARPATRYGYFLINGLHMLQMLLPGTAVVYNGDEIGMEDTFIRWDETKDPRAIIAGPERYTTQSRDGCRTPFQWDDTENAGFTKSLHTWLPVNPGYWKVNVKNELTIKNGTITHLQIFKELVKLRKNIVFQRGDLNTYVLSDRVLAITRSFVDHATYAVVINLGSEITISNLLAARPSLPQKMSVEIPSMNSNYTKGDLVQTNAITLRPKASVVLCTVEE